MSSPNLLSKTITHGRYTIEMGEFGNIYISVTGQGHFLAVDEYYHYNEGRPEPTLAVYPQGVDDAACELRVFDNIVVGDCCNLETNSQRIYDMDHLPVEQIPLELCKLANTELDVAVRTILEHRLNQEQE